MKMKNDQFTFRLISSKKKNADQNLSIYRDRKIISNLKGISPNSMDRDLKSVN